MKKKRQHLNINPSCVHIKKNVFTHVHKWKKETSEQEFERYTLKKISYNARRFKTISSPSLCLKLSCSISWSVRYFSWTRRNSSFPSFPSLQTFWFASSSIPSSLWGMWGNCYCCCFSCGCCWCRCCCHSRWTECECTLANATWYVIAMKDLTRISRAKKKRYHMQSQKNPQHFPNENCVHMYIILKWMKLESHYCSGFEAF